MHRRQLLATALGTPLATPPLTAALARPAIAQTAARTLKFVPSADLASIDPLWSLAVISGTHGYMVWDTLFGIGLDSRPHPQMVQNAEVSADGRVWTMTLRDNLIFHDNEPVRAADCLASIRRWSEKDPYGQTIAARTAEMKVLDDKRFQIALTRPLRQFLYAMGSRNLFVMPERIARTPSTQQIKEVVGSGPFRFLRDEWVSGAHAHYARFEKYVPRSEPADLWSGGKIAHFDRVEWIVQPDQATAAAALRQGQVDWVEQSPIDLIPMLRKAAGVKVEALNPFGTLAILRFNHLHPPFDNPKLRRALLSAIDQQAYMSAVVGEQTDLAKHNVGFFTAGGPMENNAGMAALTSPRDLALTRRLIAESGYKGERIVMVAPSDLPAMMTMGQVTQDLMTRLGLNVDFQVMDWGTMISRMAKRDPVSAGGWSCYCVTWAGLTAATPGSSYPLRANGLGAGTGWPTDETLEALRTKWLDAGDAETEKAVAREIQTRAFETLPYIPLGQLYPASAYRDRLTGFVRSPLPLFWNVRAV